MDRVVLAVDLGTSSVKVQALTFDGTVIARCSADYPVLHPRPGHAEQDPSAWWQATTTAIRTLAHREDFGQRIAAIGITGQMHGATLLDQALHPLRPAIIWMDQRSHDDVIAITEDVGRERLISIAGSSLATGFQAASVRWVARHEPRVWERVAYVLTPKDWLRLQLTGEIATDPSDASGTLLFDVTRRQWSPALIAAAGLRADQLPSVQPSAAIGGHLRAPLATELGLRANIPVIVGAGDTPAAAVGAGIFSDKTLMLSLSTGTQQYVPSTAPNIDAAGRLHTWCSAFEPESGRPTWYQMSATLNGGSAIRWFGRNVLNLGGPNPDEELFSLAAASPPGANGLLFVPYLVGERSPLFDSGARGAFIGLTDRHGRAELARAVVEGVTLAAADAFADLRDAGADPRSLVAVGGGARSDLWLRVAADVFQLPVRAAGITDQSARGAGLLAAATASGASFTELTQQWAEVSAPVEPDPTLAPLYRERMETLRQVHAAIRPQLGSLSSTRADPAP